MSTIENNIASVPTFPCVVTHDNATILRIESRNRAGEARELVIDLQKFWSDEYTPTNKEFGLVDELTSTMENRPTERMIHLSDLRALKEIRDKLNPVQSTPTPIQTVDSSTVKTTNTVDSSTVETTNTVDSSTVETTNTVEPELYIPLQPIRRRRRRRQLDTMTVSNGSVTNGDIIAIKEQESILIAEFLMSKRFRSQETFADDISKTIERLKAKIEVWEGDPYWQIGYDIPAVFTTRGVVGNPSRQFWGMGLIRTSLSTWMFKPELLKNAEFIRTLAEWRQATIEELPREKVTFWLTEVSPRSMKTQLRLAEGQLQNYLVGLHTSLIANIASADEKLQKAIENVEANEAILLRSGRMNTVRAQLKKCSEDLDNVIKCAEHFDMTMNVEDLIHALRESLKSQQITFNMEAQTLGVKPSRLAI